jgi:hypothetical protein
MIGPEQRVFKPARKSGRNVAAAMGERWRRTGGPQEQRYGDGWNFVFPPLCYASIGRTPALVRSFSLSNRIEQRGKPLAP